MSDPDSDHHVAAVRAFNRFYTRKLGKRRRCTRRFGGRRDRRVLEGMRGCSTHGQNIARIENKSRT